ncbi:DegT/DnrJ/EryC1/StrS family aminotransferase [Rubripirellula reticaptiva]|uniref:UDP-4-amino-4-deoxy-L-arabinose--oxoglutarate aminotransferase n=1 Tax=Rubripirellula reticaptiva TaxID=2528013 RepID=A0A5C6EGV5_9BACT|nr:DegT/DnrJ/EryC1/StrS family aminotransferase [Rubripirellula reticaptiva]TWU47770.1 UDP-4-amino-4-deoxy-L-arabinose--oxoglutarate aminotransferase [Rubripirellula reticaptiva]
MLDLPAWPPLWPSISAAAFDCVNSGDWGRYDSAAVTQLQSRLTQMTGSATARTCCSGSAAVELALRAAGVGPGDEVITAAFDYPGNVRAIELIGGKPVLADVASGTPCLDLTSVEAAASPLVKAVVASHLFGVPADVVELKRICEDRGWFLIEDACQVAGMQIGAMQIEGRAAGSIGHFGTWSTGGSKLITCGSGGVIFASDDRSAARLNPILDRPSDAFAMPPLAAAMVLPQLDRLDEMNGRRSETAVFIRDHVLPEQTNWTWESGDRDKSAFYKVAFTVESTERRETIIAKAGQVGLPIGVGFRSLAGTSTRRCRKPVPLDRSQMLGERLMVLDHRALMIPPDRWDELASAFAKLVKK